MSLDKISLLDHLEIEYRNNDMDCITECLWCGSDNKLSMSRDEGNIFQCWSCKERGNGLSFMRKFYSLLPEITPATARQFTALKPGIAITTVRDEGIRFDGSFWIPVKNLDGNIVALHKYDTTTGIIYSSPKPFACSILGLDRFKPEPDSEVWIAEGHADYLILRQVLNKVPGAPHMLGTCGAGFSGSYLHLLSDKHVVLLFDNDDAGRSGIQSVARRIKQSGSSVKSLKFLDWSGVTVPQHDELPKGFDLRDLFNSMKG